MSDPYADFLARKAIVAPPVGIEADMELPKALKPFQRDITQWALRRGRAALFEGTGLGKTLQELAWAQAVARHEDAPVLLVTPLGVAHQTVKEAEKFGIKGVAYAKHSGEMTGPIVVTNYDRFDRFDVTEFAGIVLDESSIIKSHDSATRKMMIETCGDIPYRLCGTATPAPNDYIELGNHAEFLGVMSEKEMLAMFFVHEGSVRAGAGNPEWRLKRHAEQAFWRWLASWAVMIRRPRDLGYEDAEYELPALNRKQVSVAVEYMPSVNSGLLFPIEAQTLQERLGARRDSIDERVKAAADIVNAQPDRPWLVWCNLNAEADALVAAIPDAKQVRGADDPDLKSSRLLGFVDGTPRVLVTKPSIGGFGMNWQHCGDMVFVGLNDSFEQLFQAVRRCWRFGRSGPVNAYFIASELEGAVVANVAAKEARFENMLDAMAEHMRAFSTQEIRGGRRQVSTYNPQTKMELPEWLT